MNIIGSSAMLIWGPGYMIGGEFSDAIAEMLSAKLKISHKSCQIFVPDGEWKSYIENTFRERLAEKRINLYRHNKRARSNGHEKSQYIVQITDEWFKLDLPNTQQIKNELYSYFSVEDFLHSGFGLALVSDDEVCGFCIRTYSIDNECSMNVWVAEKHRGLGYAKMLTNRFLAHEANKNWNIFWSCSPDNIASNKTARSCGFVLHSNINFYHIH